jgi:High-affinity nickel-transport protein
VNFEILYQPVEHLDDWLAGLFSGAPLLAALALAALLGFRHASDPDHLVAVTSIVAARDGDARAGMRIGAWWGLGHGLMLVAIGAPLILLRSELPEWLASGAETAIGLVIVALALRVLWKWLRGDYRAGPHRHGPSVHRHLHHDGPHDHPAPPARTPIQALSLGMLHGLGGSGAVVLLLIVGLPGQAAALAALAVYAPMTMLSMALCTGAYAWVLTRRLIQPLYRTALIPGFASFSLLFGLWYAGLA